MERTRTKTPARPSDTVDEQYDAEDAVVREALNSTWNAYGGDKAWDQPENPDRVICRVAGCGLDQSILEVIEGWDQDDVFGKSLWATRKPKTGRASAMIGSLRRVVSKGVEDGVLIPVTVSQRYSLGVTFASGREL